VKLAQPIEMIEKGRKEKLGLQLHPTPSNKFSNTRETSKQAIQVSDRGFDQIL